MTTDS